MSDERYAGTSAQAIQSHYDRGSAFYALWLDPTMTYSAAIWDGADGLEDAQRKKLAFHAREAGVTADARVLDVGCGWGGMLQHLADEHGVRDAVGLTLSADQARVARARGLTGVDVRLEGWADHQPDAPYDAVISIGALEHFARMDHDRAEKVAAYRHFFEHVFGLMRPGARMSLQTIVYGTLDTLDPFIQQRIWPESNLPRLDEVVQATDKLFEVQRLRNDRMDYARTCAVWAQNMAARADEVVELAGRQTFEDYIRYLKMSARAFELGAMGLVRLRLVRTS